MTTQIESVEFHGVQYAMIFRKPRADNRVEFYTSPESPFQLGAFNMQKGSTIPPHIHQPCRRELHATTEVLVIQSGELQVDFYDEHRTFCGSKTLTTGDVIILLEGGHGFRVTEDLTMLEIKQGPYAGDLDKVRFQAPQ